MTLYHEWCFTELHKIVVNEITFVDFRGGDRPNRSPSGSTLGTAQLRTLEGTLLAGFPVQRIAT